jgi:hypothetical protein
MILRLRNPLLFTLLILIYVLFSYSFLGDWLYSSIGTILIIFLSFLIWGNGFLEKVGLQLNLETFVKSIILVVIIAGCSFLIMKYLGKKNDIRIEYYNWRDYYHVMFYVLNEEIVLGAILLFTLVYKWKVRPIVASICLAVGFALFHYVFYRWVFADRGVLGISTLMTLFLVGIVRNSLILYTGHIGYSWALHFGWIAIMFGSRHTNLNTNMYLSELESFNTYLGSTQMLVLSIIIAGVFLVYWLRKYNPHHVRIHY